MDLGIAGKTALITGGDSGIGWQTAQTLRAEGARVVITDLDPGRLDAAAERLRADAPTGAAANGPADEPEVHAFPADVTRPEDLARLHDEVREAVGPVDIVVHAAGITGAQGLFHEIDDAGWVGTLETDLLGAVRVTREFLGDLRRGWGRLVYLASEDAAQPYDDELPYCVAKAGVRALAKGLSRSYAREGLLVNTVSPAFIHTPMTDAMMDRRAEQLGVDREDAIASFLDEKRPFLELKRRGKPEEVAAVIAFLCSQLASFVNGSDYRVDAGSVATV